MEPEKLQLPPTQPTSPKPLKEAAIPFFAQIEQIKADSQKFLQNQLRKYRHERIRFLEEKRNSRVIVYYAWELLEHADAQYLYEVLSKIGKVDNLDLLILSPGGLSDPAFKISRLCQEFTKKKFSVLIPLYAKSAATILALGADEIVMGSASELGPIDPQIRTTDPSGKRKYLPLLALRDALDFIKGEVANAPENALLFMPMLEKIDLLSLGHYNREIDSSKQYAEDLLKQRMFKKDPNKAKKIASKLVDSYKTHGYVIDKKEASENLELNVVDVPEEQWTAIWQLHNLYDSHLRDLRLQRNVAAKVIETIELYLVPIKSSGESEL